MERGKQHNKQFKLDAVAYRKESIKHAIKKIHNASKQNKLTLL